MVNLLLGLYNPFGWRHPPSNTISSTILLFVGSYHRLHIKHVFVHECIPLVDESAFGVKYLWIPSIYDILDNVCILVHPSFILINKASIPAASFRLFVLFPFLSVFTHHIFPSNLVKSIAHFGQKAIFEALELLQLNELNIFYGALRWRLGLKVYLLWQYGIGWDEILFLLFAGLRCLLYIDLGA